MSDSTAVDEHGRPLPYSSEQVDAIVQKALETGDIMAAIIRMPDGALAVQVWGPPSRELLDILETVTRAYRRTLAGE